MVLTEQKDSAFYPAVTFEDANTTNEQIYYENAGDQRTVMYQISWRQQLTKKQIFYRGLYGVSVLFLV